VLEAERHRLILRILRQGRAAAVVELAELLQASRATVRRDLAKLEEAGSLRRVRGGAELEIEALAEAGPAGQLPFDYRKGVMLESKRRIARQAVSLCREEETVMIDGGSTTFQMVPFLLHRRLRIITNSFAIAEQLIGHSGNTVILTGGVVYPESQLILDPFPEDVFRNYSAARVFMGVYGIDEQGATNAEELVITTERAMIAHAGELVILADSSKFERRGSLRLCGFDRIHTIITDSALEERRRRMVLDQGVRLLVV
jgi:DeoR family ulaG and ulaABCDEF operon transcriptional repressor